MNEVEVSIQSFIFDIRESSSVVEQRIEDIVVGYDFTSHFAVMLTIQLIITDGYSAPMNSCQHLLYN